MQRYSELLLTFSNYRKLNAIIDIGAGDGPFAAAAKQAGWNSYATEFEDRAVNLCKEKGVVTHQGKIDPSNYDSGMFDVTYSSEVIELPWTHLPRERLKAEREPSTAG